MRAVIAATAFLLGFVALGALVLFFAFGGGARGAREQLHAGQSRTGRRVASVVVAVVVVGFGVAIPGLVIAHNNDSQSKNATGGLELSAFQQHGRELFAKNCSTCHTLAAASAVGKVGPNLDTLASLSNEKASRALVIDAVKNGRARGMGQMPAELLSGEDLQQVASFVAVAHGR